MSTDQRQIDSRLWGLKRRYDAIVGDIPWLRAVGPVVSIMGISVVLVANIPTDINSITETIYFWPSIFVFFTFLYLFLTTVYANDRLRTERRLRQVEEGFNYDSRGTLWNGGEPNIAFRITTFKGILAGLNSNLKAENLSSAMTEAGKAAAEDFATSFDSIYDADIRSKKGGASWSDLRLHQKLHEWAEYDSSTGWGILSVTVEGDEIKVEIIHLNGLYEGEGGQIFGHFIAGYCETVVANIIRSQNSGKFSNFTTATISRGPVFEGETATLTLIPE